MALNHHSRLVYFSQRSGASFIDNVERGFRGSPETGEAGRGNYLSDARFTGLRA
jgi:hypothetical protein